VVPFLVVSWRTPNTYPTGGVRRGTATQIPRDPGQPHEEGPVDLELVDRQVLELTKTSRDTAGRLWSFEL